MSGNDERVYVEENTYPEYMKPKVSKPKLGRLVFLLVPLMLIIALVFVWNSPFTYGFIEVESDIEMEYFEVLAGTTLTYRNMVESYPDRRITVEGMEYIQNILSRGVNETLAPFNYIAIGTGADSFDVEIMRIEGTVAESALNAFKVTAFFPAGTFSGESVSEFGVFNDSGLQLFHLTIGVGFPLYDVDSLKVEVEITIGLI